MPPSHSQTRVVVRRPMNHHGAVTVEVCDTNETRHLAEYASAEFRRTLAALPPGTTIPLAMTRVGVRSNVWRVTAVYDGDRARAGDEVPGRASRSSL